MQFSTAIAFFANTCRLAGTEAAIGDPLAVPAAEDPLACLQDQPSAAVDMGTMDPGALDYLDHKLMVTDDVRSVLAVLAPWLAAQLPFLLVSRASCDDAMVVVA